MNEPTVMIVASHLATLFAGMAGAGAVGAAWTWLEDEPVCILLSLGSIVLGAMSLFMLYSGH